MKFKLVCTGTFALGSAATWLGCTLTAGTWRDCAAVVLITLGSVAASLALAGYALAWLCEADGEEPGRADLVTPEHADGGMHPITQEWLTDHGFAVVGRPLRLFRGSANPFDHAAIGSTHYCEDCRDWLPEEGDQLCEHLTWCERKSEWVKLGKTCPCENCTRFRSRR